MARTVNAEGHMGRREPFVDAAGRLRQTRGDEQMTVQDVRDALGASRGAFYHYCDSKQGRLEAVRDRMGDAGLGSGARRKRLISCEEVVRTMATDGEAFDRVLGAPLGTSNLGDEAVMREWFG